jgi:hypothetical protein
VALFRRWVELGGRDVIALEAYAKTPGLGNRLDFQALLGTLKPETAPVSRRVSPIPTRPAGGGR